MEYLCSLLSILVCDLMDLPILKGLSLIEFLFTYLGTYACLLQTYRDNEASNSLLSIKGDQGCKYLLCNNRSR